MDTQQTTPAEKSNERHLTVARKYFARGRDYVQAPEIRVAGLYLEKLGFTIGSKVILIEKPAEVIIRLDKAAPQQDPKETADDRRIAYRAKQVADFIEKTKDREQPIKEITFAHYISGTLPVLMHTILSILLDEKVPESFKPDVYELLNRKHNPTLEKILTQSLLSQLNNLPKPKRKPSPKRQAQIAPSEPIEKQSATLPTGEPAPQPIAAAPQSALQPPATELPMAAEPEAQPARPMQLPIPGLLHPIIPILTPA
jgi:hypothetical protein